MLLAGFSLLLAVALGGALYLVAWIAYCRFLHPLRSISGPFLASWSRAWVVYHTMQGNMEHKQRALHKRHGFLVRIAPNEVACSDPSAISTIYGPRSKYVKTDYYDAWAPPTTGYVGHFPARNEEEHAARRRIVNGVYSMSSVLDCEHSIDVCTQLLMSTLKDFASEGRVVDMSLWMNMYAFDVLGELFYGQMFGFISERRDIGNYMKCIDSLLPAFTIGGSLPSYLTKLYLISTVLFSPSVRGALGTVKHIEEASKAAVRKRREEVEAGIDSKRDIVRKMLEINEERGEQVDFTMAHICVESHSSLFAGADTTAIALNSVLYHLLRKPTAYDSLRAEVDEAVAKGTISVPVAYSQAIKLPYLSACVNEGMRLHPAVGLTLPRQVPAGGAMISGQYIPAGYRVGINGAVVHYDQGIFGLDADDFRPERWLDSDTTAMNGTMLQFGGGSRTCIGKNISLSEIYKLIPQLIYEFNVSLRKPNQPWKTRNFWFNKQTDILVFFEERKH